MTKEQLITDNYAIYNSDCMEVIKDIPDNSSLSVIIRCEKLSSLFKFHIPAMGLNLLLSHQKESERLLLAISLTTDSLIDSSPDRTVINQLSFNILYLGKI